MWRVSRLWVFWYLQTSLLFNCIQPKCSLVPRTNKTRLSVSFESGGRIVVSKSFLPCYPLIISPECLACMLVVCLLNKNCWSWWSVEALCAKCKHLFLLTTCTVLCWRSGPRWLVQPCEDRTQVSNSEIYQRCCKRYSCVHLALSCFILEMPCLLWIQSDLMVLLVSQDALYVTSAGFIRAWTCTTAVRFEICAPVSITNIANWIAGLASFQLA